jgi:cytochrome P450/ferredoxin-NADP reductase
MSMSGCPFSNSAKAWEDFATLRETPGLVWNDNMQRWVVSRYEDITAALHDPATFSSQPVVPTAPPPVQAAFAGKVPDRGTLIGHDNPTHDRLRSAVNTFFMPRRIARYESWIEAQAHALIDEFYEEGELDFRERFSSPLPLKVISHIVGLDVSRSEEYHEALLFFSHPSPERIQPLIDFHAYVETVIEERRHDRRDDLISHVWNMRESGESVMTDFEMLSLFPGLMLAGHETSSNLIVMALAHMLARPGMYEWAQRSDENRARALEEAFRFEGPITGMPRVVTKPVTLGGQNLKPGDEVFLAYGSGNRDAAHFDEGDGFDVERGLRAQHIAFGQGIHACLGAPLARLLLKVEMRVIADRLPGLRFAIPYDERTYTPVREVRALVDTPFAWDVLDSHRAKRGRHAAPAEVAADDGWIEAQVVALQPAADGVVEVTLGAKDGDLPGWTAGAHAEIELPNGVIRQYSLCGAAREGTRWAIAVARDPAGRGGSIYIHDALRTGDRVRLRPPRNHFALRSTQAPVVLIGGGIGITPLVTMAEDLQAARADWNLIYLGRSLGGMAYRDRLTALAPDRVSIWPSDEKGRFDLDALLAAAELGTQVCCCGPERLMHAVEGLCDSHGLAVILERFAPAEVDTSNDRPFDVVIQSTGETVHVQANESVLTALTRAGLSVLSTCQEGTCGSCEVGVAEGEILHRDTVLTREERAASETMMVCVSRCAGDRLVLQL